MAGGVDIFSIGKSGLLTNRHAMTTTSHNIANVNNENYTRQRTEMRSGPTIPRGRVNFASGVTSDGSIRVADEYLERRVDIEHRNWGKAEERSTHLDQAEQLFNEANSEGLNQLATRFFNEFRTLSAEPDSDSVRAAVRESAKHLVGDIRRMNNGIQEIQNNIDTRIEGYVMEANSLARQVRDLNIEISKVENGGGQAADLRDQRDGAIRRLGEIMEIQVGKDNFSRTTITLANSAVLVVGGTVNELEVNRTPYDPERNKAVNAYDVFIKHPVRQKLTGKMDKGRMGGLLEVRDEYLMRAKDKLDKLAYNLSTAVNQIHRQGFGFGNRTGNNFFNDLGSKVDAAARIDLSDAVKEDVANIASAAKANAPYDNRIAVAISGLANVPMDDGVSMIDSYNSMVAELGVSAGESKKQLVFQNDVLLQLKGMRDKISGVNLDEETTNLVRYQHAFAASSKVIQMADQQIKEVLAIIR